MTGPVSFRRRILLALLPSLILTVVLGSAGVLLLHRLGHSIDVILRENYESVVAMQSLKESLERIDSSFQLTLVARGLPEKEERQRQEASARALYRDNWELFEAALNKEQHNVTIHPAEDKLVERLAALTESYHKAGNTFYNRAETGLATEHDYLGDAGLYAIFRQIKQVADDVLQLNQRQMLQASATAREAATRSLVWSSIGLAGAVVLGGLLIWQTMRTILRPIQDMTAAAIGISSGNLDQVVPHATRDELGQLASAFNNMARHLRDLRQTQMSRLLRAQRTSQASIDSFPDPILVVDIDGSVEMANPAAIQVLGVDVAWADRAPWGGAAADVPAVRVPWQAPEPLRQSLTAALQVQQPYLPEGFDLAFPLPVGGQEHFFLPRILPIRDPYGATLGAAVLLQDVTRFRLLDEIKSNLVATVSHELKTPLTGVRLAVHLLLEEAVGPLTPKQTELLLDARENAELLLSRVNNLLDLTRLEHGEEKLDLHAENPSELLHAAADAIRPRADAKGLELLLTASPELPDVAVDGARLAHALGNVLENAVTYTEPGGRITLSATRSNASADSSEGSTADSPSQPPRVTLSIADTGLGITAEHVCHVFDRFFRAPGQSRGSGTGLGLAIAREIVLAQGGSITCESQPGVGTTFRIALPIWSKTLNVEAAGAGQDAATQSLGRGA
ncbi:MAG: cell wall metabolism sensor histidine kinase WalK [Planctomycetia bacterium]|nr:cell wall metabolism sensor histidine kinase WalK [Planctomycetia bacterium]